MNISKLLVILGETEPKKISEADDFLPTPSLPAHASQDDKRFQMINARLDSLEKRLRRLENPGGSWS